jgi:hypothetical protein
MNHKVMVAPKYEGQWQKRQIEKVNVRSFEKIVTLTLMVSFANSNISIPIAIFLCYITVSRAQGADSQRCELLFVSSCVSYLHN